MPTRISKDFCRNNIKKKETSTHVSENSDENAYDRNNFEEPILPEILSDSDNESDTNGTNGASESYTCLLEDLKKAPDNVIQFLSAACMSRLSENEYQRFLSVHTENFEKEVEKLWNERRNMHTTSYFCNKCGIRCGRLTKCCGPLVKFVRVGIKSQLHDVISHYYEDVMQIRHRLKTGKPMKHNLQAEFLSRRWKSESNNQLLLSGLLSIDGICIPGNTKKLWPISVMLLDLPTSSMQQSCNIILEGITESSVNPSTALWNAILPMILTDSEGTCKKIGRHDIHMKIVTANCDQPAKRALFGFRGHQSPYSCFYCLAPETFYKMEGDARYNRRKEHLTIDDSRQGKNGFSSTPAKVLRTILPYNTPIDVLHNLGEGLFAVILNEMFNRGRSRKSGLFDVNCSEVEGKCSKVVLPTSYFAIKNCRNGSDRINFFRLCVCSVAITCDSIPPEGRFVIVALSLLANRMYSPLECCKTFDKVLCESSRWFLKEASQEYISCKSHEVLYHLPYSNDLFGSAAPLSTFAFESSYQFSFMGYNSRLTRNFCEIASSRVLLHNCLRRELMERSQKEQSSRIRKFISATTGILRSTSSYRKEIQFCNIRDEDTISGVESAKLYATLHLGCGKLHSEYGNRHTVDDVFIALAEFENGSYVLAESLVELPKSDAYPSLRTAVRELTGRNAQYASAILRCLDAYEGVKYAKQSGRKLLLNPNNIVSIAAYVDCDDAYCIISTGGNPVHN